MSAALAKAARIGALSKDEALLAIDLFQSEWENLVRIQINESVLTRAASLAWNYGLRGYDATHLASALLWQEILEEPVCSHLRQRALEGERKRRISGVSRWGLKGLNVKLYCRLHLLKCLFVGVSLSNHNPFQAYWVSHAAMGVLLQNDLLLFPHSNPPPLM